MSLSNDIANVLLSMLSESGSAEIQRNELACNIGCVPSQISYVLSSRFTPERGYIVESRRGGGGYIKITKIDCDGSSMIMQVINQTGEEIDYETCKAVLTELVNSNILKIETARIILASVSERSLHDISPTFRNKIRSSIFKQTLLASANTQ